MKLTDHVGVVAVKQMPRKIERRADDSNLCTGKTKMANEALTQHVSTFIRQRLARCGLDRRDTPLSFTLTESLSPTAQRVIRRLL